MDERHCKTCVCSCTCGFGGEHVEGNPRCALTPREVDGCDAIRPVDEPAAPSAARAWDEYVRARIDAEARTGERRRVAERVRRQERRRSFEAGFAAAGPLITAQALRGAADALDRDDMAADRWYAAWLRDRAERIEKGGGRG